MTLPDREQQGGLKDEVLAGKYVLGALPDNVRAELAKRMKRDRQFAAMVRRWQDNLASAEKHDRQVLSAYIDGDVSQSLSRPRDKIRLSVPSRYHVLSAIWNSTRFWRLMTLAASLWAAVLLFTIA
jgi:anti-sigma-K factor RskA